MVVTLKKYLTNSVEVSGVGTMKDSLQANIDSRFPDIQLNEHFSVATVLDPRFKMLFFNKECIEDVKSSILTLMKEENNIVLNFSENSQKELHEIKSKVLPNNDVKNNKKSFWDCFHEISANATKVDEENSDGASETSLSHLQELENYLSKIVIERNESPFTWWKINATNFPTLAKLIKKYLSTSASSVYSERLFSEAGLLYEKKRNRIKPKHAEQLLFLHHNLRILKNSKT